MSLRPAVEAPPLRRRRIAVPLSVRNLAVEAIAIAPLLLIAAAFAFRGAPPGFRHDWTWPADRLVLVRWFIEFGLSTWNPHGLGSGPQAATFDWPLAAFATLAGLGLSAAAVLCVSLAALFTASTFGIAYLVVDVLGVRVDRHTARFLGITYALAPVCFQKTIAGHLFWLTAYAALPWFVATVWRGCRPKAGPAPFFAAALLYAISSAQFQFLAFDGVLLLAIVATHGKRKGPWLGAGMVLAIGILHNANAIFAAFDAPSGLSLADLHGTRSWEIDMSAPLTELALLGGYIGYDRAALPAALWWLPRAGFAVVLILAMLGLARRPRRATIVFSIAGLVALFFASGWYGPFASILDAALQRFVAFTIFRELYHAMAIYVLAAVVVAAFGCSVLPRPVATACAALALLSIAPFAFGGVNRLVPAVAPVAGENETAYNSGPLRVVLPFPEPLSEPGLTSGGNDPARMDDDVVNTLNAPVFMQWLLTSDIGAADQRSIAADLGIATIAFRERRVPFLQQIFEPNVGAVFGGFERHQANLGRRFSIPVAIDNARSIVQLETSPEHDALQFALADRELPPGRDVPISSSFEGNTISTYWVALHLWSWSVPELANVMSDGVVTRSGAPLELRMHAQPSDTVYVLGAGTAFALDGVAGVPSGAVAGAYRWWRWRWEHHAAADTVKLRCPGLCSVVRVRVSLADNWSVTPPGAGSPAASQAVPVRMDWPWSISGVVPPSRHATLIFGRTFSPGWHLVVAGTDLGSSRRINALFNGWNLSDAVVSRPMQIQFAPQHRANIIVALSVLLEFALIGVLISRRMTRVLNACRAM